VPPAATELVVGVAETLKSGPETVIDTLAEWVSEPLVPVMVIVEVPTGVPLPVVIVRVEVPDVLTLAGENDAVAPDGNPVALSATVPAKFPSAPTFTV
jgi:hypothetical protein